MCGVGLVYMLVGTSPISAGPTVILMVLGCFYGMTAGMLSFLLFGVQKVMRFLLPDRVRFPLYTLKYCYYLASVVALAPVMLMAMQSVGRMSWYEIVLVMTFEVVGIFYVSRRREPTV